MSANTFVTKKTWVGIRKVLATLAGVVVSMIGASSTVYAWQCLGDFDATLNIGGGVDLQAAPAGAASLGDHDDIEGAVRLVDSRHSDGLNPGEAALFGYTMALGEGGVGAAVVSVIPMPLRGDSGGLTYQVRQVTDALKCRAQWRAGRELVGPRDLRPAASPGFEVFRPADGGRPMQLCISVELAAGAGRVQTEPITWQFLASPAERMSS